jgi:flagellar biogenesis protein FliO
MIRLQASALGLLLILTTAPSVCAQLKANEIAGEVSVNTPSPTSPSPTSTSQAPAQTTTTKPSKDLTSEPAITAPNSGQNTDTPSTDTPTTTTLDSPTTTPTTPAPESAAPLTNTNNSTTTTEPAATEPTPIITTYELPERERQPLGPMGNTPGEAPSVIQDGRSQNWLLQTLTALGVVIGLIFLLRFFIQKISGTSGRLSNNSELIEILARVTIAPRTVAIFMRINQRVVVATQTANGIQPLTELTDPEDVAWVLGRIQSQQSLSVTEGFNQVLRRFDREHENAEPLGAIDDPDNDEQYVDRTRNEMSGLLSRMRNMKNRSL